MATTERIDLPTLSPDTQRGKLVVAPDFDAPLPDDLLDEFER